MRRELGDIPKAVPVLKEPPKASISSGPSIAEIQATRLVNGGWSTPLPAGSLLQEYPLMSTPQLAGEDIRYHVMKLNSKKQVDVANQSQFTRPVTLSRRDPKQPLKGTGEDSLMPDAVIDSKEQERLDIIRAEKEAQKLADLAQIAPTGKGASAVAAKKAQAFRHEKTSQVFKLDKNELDKKKSDLRYEEALPWHIEDADNKNVWVGTYEAALSDTNVIFVQDNIGTWRMIPLEKWYKFTQTKIFKAFTIEEAEMKYAKKDKESRWAMKTKDDEEMEKQIQRYHKEGRFMVKGESHTSKNATKSETADGDELDFDNEDLFQDDDEAPAMEPDKDEDVKEAKDRIKREQLGANIFGQAEENEIDEAFEKEEREEEERRKLGKDVKKALMKREKMTIYESDRSSDEYAEQSVSFQTLCAIWKTTI